MGTCSRDELIRRIEILEGMLESCRVCPHACGVNRKQGEIGECRSGYLPIVASYSAHFGEEPVLVGYGGSGTIFFGNCNLKCVYCQNYDISQHLECRKHYEISFEELADIMLYLQNRGCHNINFVSPSHFAPQILKSLLIAIPKGLFVPLVYNTNSYDSLETLRLLDGIIDIYMPDIKYSNDANALKYSNIKNYVHHSRNALKEMFRQVGLLRTNDRNIAIKGMLIRHLVLPNDIAGTKESLRFLSGHLSPKVSVNVMAQYHPSFKACEYPELNRYLTANEYNKALAYLDEFGMTNV